MDVRGLLIASRPQATEYARLLRALPADLRGAQGRVGALAIHPVKGFGALALREAVVGPRGLVDPVSGLADRAVMLAYRKRGSSPEGEHDAIGLANRNEAAFGLTRTSFEDGRLVLQARGMPPLRLDPADLAPRDGPRLRVKLPFDGAPVVDATLDEGPLAAWMRDLLGASPATRRYAPDDVVATLVRPDHARAVAAKHSAGTTRGTYFSDGAHVLVASSATLAWMNASLQANGERAIPMEAFRPNLVVDGLPPNAEDVVAEAHVGDARLLFATMCVRCDATRVDPATGTRPDKQPLAWLVRNRPPRDNDANAATFAINAIFPPDAEGRRLRVGDPVRVTGERSP